jgi:hypothetical protein
MDMNEIKWMKIMDEIIVKTFFNETFRMNLFLVKA